jgi:hypothetical protein
MSEAYAAVSAADHSSTKSRHHTELSRWVTPEKGKQNKAKEKLSRTPERKKLKREEEQEKTVTLSRAACRS